MNQGVEILLARMESNPDEFVTLDGSIMNKWGWMLDDLRRRMVPSKEEKERGYKPLRFLTDEEVQALWDKLESLRADQFTKAVMQTLLDEDSVGPFMNAVVQGIRQVNKHQKPTQLVAPKAVAQDLLKLLEKEYNDVYPSIDEAVREQIVKDLEALDKAKRSKK